MKMGLGKMEKEALKTFKGRRGRRVLRYAERVGMGVVTLEEAISNFALIDDLVTPATAEKLIRACMEELEQRGKERSSGIYNRGS